MDEVYTHIGEVIFFICPCLMIGFRLGLRKLFRSPWQDARGCICIARSSGNCPLPVIEGG